MSYLLPVQAIIEFSNKGDFEMSFPTHSIIEDLEKEVEEKSNFWNVKAGDCLQKLKELSENSVDSIVTDPPAGISFMNKEWDDDKGGRDNWIKWLSEVMTEAKRVLKPGGHALVWALPRTSHWTGFALENAGFEVRDCVYHVFGSGFPKSLNIGKAIDKLQGNEREEVDYIAPDGKKRWGGRLDGENYSSSDYGIFKGANHTKGISEWEGWGTALKPAVECWWLVRKPLSEKTIAENVLKWGTGGINIDGCRVPPTGERLGGGGEKKATFSGKEGWDRPWMNDEESVKNFSKKVKENVEHASSMGRFPAHLVHDGSQEVLDLFPVTKSGTRKAGEGGNGKNGTVSFRTNVNINHYDADEGSAARFFYCAKTSTSERNEGLEGMELRDASKMSGGEETRPGRPTNHPKMQNFHPTVKPQKLMEYLIKLITPPKGTVLDPFMGSGSTGIAAVKLNMGFIGIELNKDYFEIAKARLMNAKK